MSKDFQVGDKFHILVERLQKPNGAIIINKVLGARLALSGNEIEAIRFDSHDANGEYFDQTGKSLRAAFLRAPVNFRRISSIFGGRRHPVLGIWRRHKGTDYAASMGTPVRSVGDGVVIFAGRKGGYGNVIDIRHRNGYVSRYGHLRNFAKGIHRGAHVTIGSTIGAVGKSGLATGPHLHFEILVNGVQRDPKIALQMKGGDPIPSSERGIFQSRNSRQQLIVLASIERPLRREAFCFSRQSFDVDEQLRRSESTSQTFELRKSRSGHGFNGFERIHTDIRNGVFMVVFKNKTQRRSCVYPCKSVSIR
jgi:murein DD-endopeptidase MepM/ murein hydrolase activator NlpD